MANPIEEITEHLNARKKALLKATSTLSNAQRDVQVISGEIRAFEMALNALRGVSNISDKSLNIHKNQRGGRQRQLRTTWRRVFFEMGAGHPDGASYEQILDCAKSTGFELTASGLRTQMMLYTQQGFVTRISPGVFKLTPEGQSIALNDNEETSSRSIEDVI